MKIAQVCPYDYFRSGGVQSHIRDLSGAFREMGHDVTIISPGNNDQRSQNGVVQFGQSKKVNFNKTEVEISAAKGDELQRLKEYIENEKFDVIHFHEPWVPLLSMQILSISPYVNVATFHSATTNTFLNKSMEVLFKPAGQSTISLLDGIISVSEVPCRYLRKLTQREIEIIPNGIDVESFQISVQKISKYKNNTSILFIGRLDKRKGVKHLVKAFSRLKARTNDMRLIIAGKGKEQKSLQRYIKKNNIKDVEMLGYVSEEKKIRLLHSCDLFCSPALYGESFGIVLLEAMASEIPIVAYANPGYKTVLTGKGAQSLVEPGDIEELSNRISRVMKSADVREELITWGKKEVRNYDWQIIAQRLLDKYKAVMSNNLINAKKSKQSKLFTLINKFCSILR